MKSMLKGFFKVWLVMFLTASAVYGDCCNNGCGSCGSSCGSCCSDSCCSSNSCCSSSCNSCNYCTYGKTYFSQRDQGSHEYLVMSLTSDKRHQFDREEFYGDFDITLGWRQNFNRGKLSSYFFTKCGNLQVGANNTSGVNIRASDLGLSTTFTGCATLCPKYQDFVADFDLYLAWDEFVKGLYTELRIPLVHSRWNAGLNTSCPTSAGGDRYCRTDDDCSYFVSSTDEFVDVPSCLTGNCALKGALKGDTAFGDAPCMNAGKIDCCTRKVTGLGGIRLTLGWDFLRRERGNMGIALDVAFPAWNRPCSNNCCPLYVFDANVGSQHAWKVGGVLRGQYMLWDRDENRRLDLYLDGRAYGVFSGKTTRLMGLRSGAGSCGTCTTGSCGSCGTGCCGDFNQYLLLKKYSINSDNTIEYVSLERAANLLKMQVKSKASVEGEITALLQYKHSGFVGALGYNFYGRSCEKLCPCCCSSSCGSCCGSSCGSCCGNSCGSCNTGSCGSCGTCGSTYYYAIKGDQNVHGDNSGYYSKTDSDVRSTGTVITATDGDTLQAAAFNFGNCNTGSCCSDIDYCRAAHPNYISNMLFGNIGYNWEDVDWKPYLGVIGQVEWGNKNTALSLWGVYLKGGICF